MTQISVDIIYQAQQRAINTYKRGLHLVALGKSFEGDKNIGVQECGRFIEQRGLLVQQHAQQALILAEQISIRTDSSTYFYNQTVFARAKAVKLYTQAMIVYTQVTEGKYKAAKIRLHLPDR